MPDYLRFLVYATMLLSQSSWANIEPLALTALNSSVIGNSTVITLDLNRAPQWQEVKVQRRGNLLELRLPDTIASAAGKFHPVDSPYVLKLLPLQLDEHTSLRVFASTEGNLLQQATTVEVAGKQVIVFVDHNKLQPVSSEQAAPSQAQVGGWLGKIQLAAIVLVAILTLLLCLFGLWRVFVWRQRRLYNNGQNSILRNIGQLALSAQHRLALIEVYGQRLLFTVSERNVELLSSSDFNANTMPETKQRAAPRLPPSPPPSAQLDHDIYVNENSLSAQKTMQRGQHYRETLPRVTSEQAPRALSGNGAGLPKDNAAR